MPRHSPRPFRWMAARQIPLSRSQRRTPGRFGAVRVSMVASSVRPSGTAPNDTASMSLGVNGTGLPTVAPDWGSHTCTRAPSLDAVSSNNRLSLVAPAATVVKPGVSDVILVAPRSGSISQTVDEPDTVAAIIGAPSAL